jgi:hypothetical protein
VSWKTGQAFGPGFRKVSDHLRHRPQGVFGARRALYQFVGELGVMASQTCSPGDLQ